LAEKVFIEILTYFFMSPPNSGPVCPFVSTRNFKNKGP
jgi:hypothetical protein